MSAKRQLITAAAVVLTLGFALSPALAAKPIVRRVLRPNAIRPHQEPLAMVGIAYPAGYNYVPTGTTAGLYEDLRNGIVTLLQRYAPEKHFFVGVGRDPAPLIAFLQLLGDPQIQGHDVAVNFPGTSNGNRKQAPSRAPAAMPHYVEKLIPSAVRDSDRTIVFVDVTMSGSGLKVWAEIISSSLKNPTKTVAFGDPSSPITGVDEHISTEGFYEIARFPWDPYENRVSEYRKHSPGVQPIDQLGSTLKGYTRFKDAINQHMVADPVLDQFLLSMGASY